MFSMQEDEINQVSNSLVENLLPQHAKNSDSAVQNKKLK